jgi:hypothetical protein
MHDSAVVTSAHTDLWSQLSPETVWTCGECYFMHCRLLWIDHWLNLILLCTHMFYFGYITLHYMDPELVKMTVGCGISHTITKTHIQYNWSIPYIHTHTYKYKSNTVNSHYVHRHLRGWVSFRH